MLTIALKYKNIDSNI